jgi:hypothetical protein
MLELPQQGRSAASAAGELSFRPSVQCALDCRRGRLCCVFVARTNRGMRRSQPRGRLLQRFVLERTAALRDIATILR